MQATESTTAMNELKQKYEGLMNQSRQRLGQMNAQMTRMKEMINQLQNQVKELTAEKERLAAQSNSEGAKSAEDTAALDQLKASVETLTREKTEIEKALAEQIEKSDKLIAENKAALVIYF
jgi:phage shock protein A